MATVIVWCGVSERGTRPGLRPATFMQTPGFRIVFDWLVVAAVAKLGTAISAAERIEKMGNVASRMEHTETIQ